MSSAVFQVPVPKDEPVSDYAPGTAERAHVRNALHNLSNRQIEIPLIIAGREVRTGNIGQAVIPHNHDRVLATYHKAGPAEVHQYPRIVGETGGKDFVLAHRTADTPALVTALIRGAFEYQGQKCSAASQAYIPDNLWPEVRDGLLAEVSTVEVGDVSDFTNFMGAVIDADAFKKIVTFIELAQSSPETEILAGGECDDREGYFIQPTVVLTQDPRHRLMEEEIFGPVLNIYVYSQNQYEETLQLCDSTSPYGLTGAIFAQAWWAVQQATTRLWHAAGNFCINDKPTGAVGGLQPFGGSRASGTNDKAGSPLDLERWVTPHTIKESFCPPTDYRYPFMGEE